YGDRLLGHYDEVDPREDLLGHLLIDAPLETAAVGGILTGLWRASSGHQDAVSTSTKVFFGILGLAAIAGANYR
ncbi:MAG: hypothetical protein ACE5JL_06540, partial [Dehalococcoidia bacterium]